MNYLKVGSSMVSAWLGSVPSGLYAFLYLALIPMFAAVYTAIDRDFYHSTIQYEQIIHTEEDEVLRDLRKQLRETFMDAHGKEVVVSNGWRLDFTSISLYGLKIESDTASMVLMAEFFTMDRLPLQTIVHLSIKVPILPPMRQMSPEGRWTDFRPVAIEEHPFPRIKDLEPPPVGLIFARPESDLAASEPMMRSSREFSSKLLAVALARQGFPSRVDGSFGRMLYLSTVTITTLGYGDILPLTSRARSWIALESILGIVVIGLFLNSLAREHSGKDPETGE